MIIRKIARTCAACVFGAVFLLPQSPAQEVKRTGGPYVPTPQIVVDEMLRFAKVGADDFVIDLGSGDGVIVLTAAQRFKARGLGVDIDPALVKLSNDKAKRLGVADRTTFLVQDVFKADLSRASVLTLYLLPQMMAQLQWKVFTELRPGARVVSHDYDFGDWQPDDQITFDVPEKEDINGVPLATVYLWIVPAQAAGTWRVRIDGGAKGGDYELDIRQKFQMIEGHATAGGRTASLQLATLRGSSIRFAVPAGPGRDVFSGTVNGGSMQGTVELAAHEKPSRWTAERIGPP